MSNLPPKKQLAIAEFLKGLSSEDVAAVVGVTGRTVARWMADPIFKQELDQKSTRLNSSHSQQSRMPSSA